MLLSVSRLGWLLLAANLASAQTSPANADIASQQVIEQTRDVSPARLRQLAEQFQEGRGVGKDLTAAFRLYERAAGLGDNNAQVQVGYMLAKGQGTAADPQQAFRWFLRAASDGNRRAQYNVAVSYIKGTGVRADPAEGLSWLRKSAQKGDPRAEADLGGLYGTGRLVPKDCGLARHWSEKAAKQGIALAETNLAAADLGECDGRSNIPRGLILLRRAAVHGSPEAQYRLGQMLAEGLLLPHDDAAALKWFLAAAGQDIAPAQFVAGMFYEFGRGMPSPDYTQAAQWYFAAVKHDFPAAEMNLGAMLERGLVPGHAAIEALRWYTRAAQQGQPNAQLALGKHYEEGVGVPRDLATAAEWYARAASRLDVAQAALNALLANHPELLHANLAMPTSPCAGLPAFGPLPGEAACPQSGERR